MSVIGSNILAGASGQGGGYNLTRSLRFRSSASAYLNRTPASAGNRQVWTWSGWIKRGKLTSDTIFFGAFTTAGSGTDTTYLRFNSSDNLWFYVDGAGGASLVTTQVFRDPSAWYHLVVSVDTTQATASNRVLMYINGVQITSFSTSTYPTQNANLFVNNTIQHNFGTWTPTGSLNFDGYLTEVNFIDGQALTPSSFGETSTTTGVWQPKKYAGTYGTNGFYLPFTNNSTTTTLGNDFSGNGNNWTTNNISLTAGATYDSMTDVPTLTSATASNFAVLNPIYPFSTPNGTFTNGNLTLTGPNTTYWYAGVSSIPMSSGKWYCEVTFTSNTGSSNNQFGICSATNTTSDFPSTALGYGYQGANGNKRNNNTASAYGASISQGDIVGIAFDADNGTLTFYKNSVSQGTAFTGIAAGTYVFAINCNPNVLDINFGQRPFAYTPPTGFVALNTFNLPTPTIGATASSQANKYMNIVTYTGNGSSSRQVTGVGFQPDFTWVKSRNYNFSNYLYDVIRTAGKALYSNNTNAEATDGGFTSFDADGFTLSNGALNDVTIPTNYVAWNWKANGTGVTNTAGSITSTVSANTSSGFSVVTYTGTQVAGTIGHGLGVAPSMIIVKARSNGVYSWAVYHATQGANKYLLLNSTAAVDTGTTTWNNTSPTSTVFSVGADVGTNKSGDTYVAYCFSAVAGYSAFGSYTGNGSTDGNFIFTGFKPRFIMIKQTSSSNDWCIFDTTRNTYNSATNVLYPNLSNAEASFPTGQGIDVLSNGFKLRYGTPSIINTTGATYIYAAFAEVPTKFSLAQ